VCTRIWRAHVSGAPGVPAWVTGAGPAGVGGAARPGVAPLPGLGWHPCPAWVGPPQPGGAGPAGWGRPTLGGPAPPWGGRPGLGWAGLGCLGCPAHPARPARPGCVGCCRAPAVPAAGAEEDVLVGRRGALASNATLADAALQHQDVLRVSCGAGSAAARRSEARGLRAARPDDSRQSTCRARRADAQLWQCQVAGLRERVHV